MKNAAMVVRLATPDDLPSMLEIEAAGFPEPWSAESLARTIDEPAMAALVAVDADGIAGYAAGWSVGDEADISRIAVAPALRRRGIGRLLLAATVREFAARGARRIFLDVRQSNDAARRLYEAAAFCKIGVRRRYYSDGEDAVVMSHHLDAQEL